MFNTSIQPFVLAAANWMLVACGTVDPASISLEEKSSRLVSKTIHPTGQKPGAPVTLKYQLPEQISPGEEVPIELEFTTSTDQGVLDITLKPGDGLLLQSAPNTRFTLEEDGRYHLDVSVVAPADGIYPLGILAAETDFSQQYRMARTFAVSLKVGTGAVSSKPNPSLVRRPSGEWVVEMPAEEG